MRLEILTSKQKGTDLKMITANKTATYKYLNITAYNGVQEVSLQISDDMDAETIMKALDVWLEWGYSFKAGYDSKVNA
jgi:hypothetical protein